MFDNDFAALMPIAARQVGSAEVEGGLAVGAILPPGTSPCGRPGQAQGQPLLVAVPVQGICRVVCFSPRHDLTLAEMPVAEIRRVVDAWASQTTDLGARPFIHYVQVFENRGAMMGASNPHPHGQIWATEAIPNEPAKEAHHQETYFASHGRPLLLDYLDLELAAGERIVCLNDDWIVLAPFWAVWPFETLVLPRRAVGALPDLDDTQRDALADILKRLTTRYDNLFEVSFPYSMGWHQRPTGGGAYPGWVLHAHFYPPLLRSATVRKFMVGFEMLGEPQRDIPAEAAAARLRALSEVHHRQRSNGP